MSDETLLRELVKPENHYPLTSLGMQVVEPAGGSWSIGMFYSWGEAGAYQPPTESSPGAAHHSRGSLTGYVLIDALGRASKDLSFAVPLLWHSDTDVVLTGIKLMSQYGEQVETQSARDAVEALRRVAHGHTDVRVRYMGMETLRGLDDAQGQSVVRVADVERMVQDHAAEVRILGMEILQWEITPRIKRMRSDEEIERADAVTRQLVPYLVALFDDTNSVLRYMADQEMRQLLLFENQTTRFNGDSSVTPVGVPDRYRVEDESRQARQAMKRQWQTYWSSWQADRQAAR